MKEIIEKLTDEKKTISTMESCTGGYLVNEITNIPGASEIIKFGAVTYSNEYKIKLGVNPDIISKYTVYSKETANEMSRVISNYTESNYGIGITGKLNREDINNPCGNDNIVYISIYDRDNKSFSDLELETIDDTREKNKEYIINSVLELLKDIIVK